MKKLKQGWSESSSQFRERQWEEDIKYRYHLRDKLWSLNITHAEKERITSMIYGDKESYNLAEIIINHKYDTARNNRSCT